MFCFAVVVGDYLSSGHSAAAGAGSSTTVPSANVVRVRPSGSFETDDPLRYSYVVVPSGCTTVRARSDDASRVTVEGAAERGLIDLIQREDAVHDGAPEHGASLDAALAACETPLLLTLDSDAWVRRAGWLEAFVAALGDEASHAGALKFPGGRAKRLAQWLRREPPRPEASYVRPCHAIYRVELLRRHGLSFAPRLGAA